MSRFPRDASGIAVRHILTRPQPDRYSSPERIALALLTYTHTLGKDSRPEGQTAAQFVRLQLDRLGIGQDILSIRRGRNTIVPLPPSTLTMA